jgi:carbohydrate kinase (thermoresistant glucokinase family)
VTRHSAGILLYRTRADVEVLLGHMGGPFWARRDVGAWSVPKGEHQPEEDPFAAARREFQEELGVPVPDGDPADLGTVRQSGGKQVRVWALDADLDLTRIVPGTFTMEWPRGSGRIQEFPEIDRAAWLSMTQARDKIVASQRPFLDRLTDLLMPGPDAAPGPVTAILVIGVAGSGKSTVGTRLADQLGWRYVDADELHPPANRAKMHAGQPLTDADRWPWLARVADVLDNSRPTVMACSALRREYREFLAGGRPGLRMVYLKADRALVAERLAARTGHFFPAALLDSQFQTLQEPEPDEPVLPIPAERTAAVIVERVVDWLRTSGTR